MQKFNSWKSNSTVATGGSGSLEQDGLVYRQNILIRSFEIGFDRKLSLAALTNYLQVKIVLNIFFYINSIINLECLFWCVGHCN